MNIAMLPRRLVVLIALAGLLAVPFCRPAYAVRQENPQLTQLLQDASNEAFQLAADADDMETLVQSDDNWVTHALMLARVKGHVDNLAIMIDKLTKDEQSGSVLQEQAVKQMLTLVRELSANTTAAINYLNHNKSRPDSPTYIQYLSKNAETAHQLSSMVSSLVDYEQSMAQIDRLRHLLTASGS